MACLRRNLEAPKPPGLHNLSVGPLALWEYCQPIVRDMANRIPTQINQRRQSPRGYNIGRLWRYLFDSLRANIESDRCFT